MSGNLTPVYDSLCKKYRTTRRRIFKDSNGKYKEKLEIRNCEKRTLLGSIPFEGNSNWKLDDLCDIVDNGQIVSEVQKYKKNSEDNVGRVGTNSSDGTGSDLKNTLQRIVDKLKDSRMKVGEEDAQGVKKLYEKKRESCTNEFSNGSIVSQSPHINN